MLEIASIFKTKPTNQTQKHCVNQGKHIYGPFLFCEFIYQLETLDSGLILRIWA